MISSYRDIQLKSGAVHNSGVIPKSYQRPKIYSLKAVRMYIDRYYGDAPSDLESKLDQVKKDLKGYDHGKIK